jgi:hypothetical protein
MAQCLALPSPQSEQFLIPLLICFPPPPCPPPPPRFMSLMCHEVRTPLNGCLASAEMLLETPLKVSGGKGAFLRSMHMYCQ